MMAGPEKFGTTVSTKGRVSLPAAIRKRRDWGVGTRLQVEDTLHGVLLRPVRALPRRSRRTCLVPCLTTAGRRRWNRWTLASLPKRSGATQAIDTTAEEA